MWVTPHDKLFIGVKVWWRDVTPATTAAEQEPDPFARDTAMEVPDGMQLWELPAQPRHARRQATKTIARSDLIGARLVTQAARSKVACGQAPSRAPPQDFLVSCNGERVAAIGRPRPLDKRLSQCVVTG